MRAGPFHRGPAIGDLGVGSRALRSRSTGRLALAALAAGCLALGALGPACTGGSEATVPRVPRDVEVPPYLTDTVGELARFSGREYLPVRGLGLVTGLDGTGTTVVPPGIRQQMLDAMVKHHVEGPEMVLASPDTAVVFVQGWLPPGLVKGEEFDLEIRAVPNTETTSLEGGYLLACDLREVIGARGADLGTEAVAVGRGPIFVSPFVAEEGAAPGAAKGAAPAAAKRAANDPRVGRILAGGQALDSRTFRLALLEPSLRTAEQVARLVNARFPGAAKTTRDPGRVDLTVPDAYADDKTRFLDLVGSLYLRETPDARDRRVGLLLDALAAHKDVNRVSLCLEAFGTAVVPRVKSLANHPSEVVRFNVGRILARLQDAEAVRILEPIAMDDGSDFQEEAVRALGELKAGTGLGVLGRALDAKSARVRIAAWKATVRLSPQACERVVFREKFLMTLVPTRAEPFVYFSRTEKPHVAVFGDIRVKPPVLVETRRALASAVEGGDRLTLVSRRRGKDRTAEASLALKDVVEKMAAPLPSEDYKGPTGLDLGYSDVVGVVSEIARRGALGGGIVLQPLEYRIPGERPVARPIDVDSP